MRETDSERVVRSFLVRSWTKTSAEVVGCEGALRGVQSAKNVRAVWDKYARGGNLRRKRAHPKPYRKVLLLRS